MSRLFASGGQSIGASASASALPMNIQGQLPLGLQELWSTANSLVCRIHDRSTSLHLYPLVSWTQKYNPSLLFRMSYPCYSHEPLSLVDRMWATFPLAREHSSFWSQIGVPGSQVRCLYSPWELGPSSSDSSRPAQGREQRLPEGRGREGCFFVFSFYLLIFPKGNI